MHNIHSLKENIQPYLKLLAPSVIMKYKLYVVYIQYVFKCKTFLKYCIFLCKALVSKLLAPLTFRFEQHRVFTLLVCVSILNQREINYFGSFAPWLGLVHITHH